MKEELLQAYIHIHTLDHLVKMLTNERSNHFKVFRNHYIRWPFTLTVSHTIRTLVEELFGLLSSDISGSITIVWSSSILIRIYSSQHGLLFVIKLVDHFVFLIIRNHRGIGCKLIDNQRINSLI